MFQLLYFSPPLILKKVKRRIFKRRLEEGKKKLTGGKSEGGKGAMARKCNENFWWIYVMY